MNSFTNDKLKHFSVALLATLVMSGCNSSDDDEQVELTPEREGSSVARMWNETLLNAIRSDISRPTVHSRNLFHISSAMYDAWASYSDQATPYLYGKEVNNFNCTDLNIEVPIDSLPDREEAISYAAYRLIEHRFKNSPGVSEITVSADNLMSELGYDISQSSADYSQYGASALGNHIAQCYIEYGLQDGSNEQNNYASSSYVSVNPPLSMISGSSGNPDIVDMNRWQALHLGVFTDSEGNTVNHTPSFLNPEWGQVAPFALTANDKVTYSRDDFNYNVYHDPGAPPLIGEESEPYYKWGFSLVAIWSGHLDPDDGEMIDISPASLGNNGFIPSDVSEYDQFYKLLSGGDDSQGYSINPATNQPYEPQLVPRGDYGRVLAEFWADGPNSETPPGHWFVILNEVSDHPELVKKLKGEGDLLGNLEWDIKTYFTLGGAMHDVAVAVWGIKSWYDYVRPVSAIRAMAEMGQSSDPSLPSYHEHGILLSDGAIELVTAGDELATESEENIGKIKIYAWKGPDHIPLNATTGQPEGKAGVGWILAEDWWPYQLPSFVTPPFAGYVSGHSTFSRAAAEVLTLLTGDEYFPGGMSSFEIKQNEFLVFERGPSIDLVLQWATYRDASDQASLSRIWGGIHPPADDIPGRFIGMQVGPEAVNFAENYFLGTAN